MHTSDLQDLITIAKEITNDLAWDDYLILYTNNPERLRSLYKIPESQAIRVNGFLRNLRVKSELKSIAEAVVPPLPQHPSDEQMRAAALEMQWGNNPRKELGIYLREDSSSSWVQAGRLSLLRGMGYPFTQEDVVDQITRNLSFDIGTDGSLAVRLLETGTGPLAPEDEITIIGSILEEAYISSPEEGGPGAGIYPMVQTLWYGQGTVVKAGNTAITVATNTGQRFNHVAFQAAAAMGDATEMTFTLGRGDYILEVLYTSGTNRGIVEFFMGDESIGTLDTYSAAAANNKTTKLAFTLDLSGVQKLKTVIIDKAAASTSYFLYITALFIYPA